MFDSDLTAFDADWHRVLALIKRRPERNAKLTHPTVDYFIKVFILMPRFLGPNNLIRLT